MTAAVYMDYHAGHTELTRSLQDSFLSPEGLRHLETSAEGLVSQDAENKKLVLDQVLHVMAGFPGLPVRKFFYFPA